MADLQRKIDILEFQGIEIAAEKAVLVEKNKTNPDQTMLKTLEAKHYRAAKNTQAYILANPSDPDFLTSNPLSLTDAFLKYLGPLSAQLDTNLEQLSSATSTGMSLEKTLKISTQCSIFFTQYGAISNILNQLCGQLKAVVQGMRG